MSKFELIQQLQNPKKDDKTPLPAGIKYNQHEVILEGNSVTVFIPQRESELFEEKLRNTKTITLHQFNTLLREVRGIRG